jgi:uncharacterized protein (TIGR02145 family)
MNKRRIWQNCSIAAGIGLIALTGFGGLKGAIRPARPAAVQSPGGAGETGTVTDVDGNVYKTVKIGGQWWMAENLRVTKDPEGNPIRSFVYNNDDRMASTYGRLYTWQAMMNGSSSPETQGIAPAGWHIPSLEEWQTLIDYLGGSEVAGGKMKETGLEHWAAPNAGATNSSGLTLVAAGSYVVSQNRYCDLKAGAHILTSSSEGDFGIFVAVATHSADIGSSSIPKADIAFSVRCVKNGPAARHLQ